MALRVLDQTTLWPALDELRRKGRGPRRIATAYLGEGSAKRFPLRADDVLLTSLSVPQAARGLVSPNDLIAYRRAGVRLYREELLHAKVYLFGAVAVVGSPNLTNNSLKLDETALLTDDRAVVAALREWFAARCTQEIPDEFLRECAKAWRPPQFEPGTGPRSPARGRSARKPTLPDGDRTYLLRLSADVGDDTVAYERVKRKLERKAARTKAPKTHGTRDHFWWHGWNGVAADLRPGDTIIPVWQNGTRLDVLPYYTVLAVELSENGRGRPRTIVSFASPGDRPKMTWTRFRALAATRGVALRHRFRSGCILDPRAAATLRSLASGMVGAAT